MGAALAFISMDFVFQMLEFLAKEENYPWYSEDDAEPPVEVTKGVALAMFWGMISDVLYRDWFHFGEEKSKSCLWVTQRILLVDGLQMSDEEIYPFLGEIEELHKKDDSRYLQHLAKRICLGNHNILSWVSVTARYSACMASTQIDLLNFLDKASDLDLAQYVVDNATARRKH